MPSPETLDATFRAGEHRTYQAEVFRRGKGPRAHVAETDAELGAEREGGGGGGGGGEGGVVVHL